MNVLKAVLRLALPLAVLPAVLSQAAWAAPVDDRQVLQRFANTGAITNRALEDDLARSSWSRTELRSALVRAYGLSATGVSQFLRTPAGTALLQRHLLWWSPDLAPEVRLAALRAAIVADSRDGAISLLGVVKALPVRFELPRSPLSQPSVSAAACACPLECGSSSLAQLAFLIACLQAGATAAPAPTPAP